MFQNSAFCAQCLQKCALKFCIHILVTKMHFLCKLVFSLTKYLYLYDLYYLYGK